MAADNTLDINTPGLTPSQKEFIKGDVTLDANTPGLTPRQKEFINQPIPPFAPPTAQTQEETARASKQSLTETWAQTQRTKNKAAYDPAAAQQFAQDYTVDAKVEVAQVGEMRKEADRDRIAARMAEVQAANPALAGKTFSDPPLYQDQNQIKRDEKYAAAAAMGEKPNAALFAQEDKLPDQTLVAIGSGNFSKGQGKALFAQAASPNGLPPVDFSSEHPEQGLNAATKSLGGNWVPGSDPKLQPYFGAQYYSCDCKSATQAGQMTTSLASSGIGTVEGNNGQRLFITQDEAQHITPEKLSLTKAIADSTPKIEAPKLEAPKLSNPLEKILPSVKAGAAAP